jgi:hypothetical protein
MITRIAELITAATLRLWGFRADEVLAIELPVIKSRARDLAAE